MTQPFFLSNSQLIVDKSYSPGDVVPIGKLMLFTVVHATVMDIQYYIGLKAKHCCSTHILCKFNIVPAQAKYQVSCVPQINAVFD